MNNNILSPSCPSTSTHTYPILDDLQVSIRITHNPFQLPLDALFAMAARKNKKRGFLFVSKVLGKHIPVRPHTSLLSGAALALLLYREASVEPDPQLAGLLQETVEGLIRPERSEAAYRSLIAAGLRLPHPFRFIGFAETATALGHSMYSVFADSCTYVHTTRERIPSLASLINFEEEHSHAVAHRCYALNPEALAGGEPIVLVDDEMTTGKTTLNIIRDLHNKYPRPVYIVASLLDWRTEEDERRFAELEDELGVTIRALSLVKGEIAVQGQPVEGGPLPAAAAPDRSAEVRCIHLGAAPGAVAAPSEDEAGAVNASPYLPYTGRFGIASASHAEIEAYVQAAADRLRGQRAGGSILCLGTGEFMYIPMQIAAHLGADVWYQSTTRSPIHPVDRDGYAVKTGQAYASPEDPEVMNFIYNIAPGQYEELYVFLERDQPQERMEPLIQAFQRLGVPQVRLVFCAADMYGWGEKLR